MDTPPRQDGKVGLDTSAASPQAEVEREAQSSNPSLAPTAPYSGGPGRKRGPKISMKGLARIFGAKPSKPSGGAGAMTKMETVRAERYDIADPKVRAQAGVWYKSEVPEDQRPIMLSSPEHFEGQKHALTARSDVPASKALEGFKEGPTVSDCLAACCYCQYEELKDALGKKKFDAIFSDTNPVVIHSRQFPPQLAYFMKTENLDSAKDLKKGDTVYIEGVPDYGKRHPRGEATGWNAVTVGHNENKEPLFAGLGLADTPAEAKQGFTESQVRFKMVEDYNQLPDLRTLRSNGQRLNTPIEPQTMSKLEKVYEAQPDASQSFATDMEEIEHRAEKAGVSFTTEERALVSQILSEIPPRVPQEASEATGLILEADRIDPDKVAKARKQSAAQTTDGIRAYRNR